MKKIYKHQQYGLGFNVSKDIFNTCQVCWYYRSKYYNKPYCNRKHNRNLIKCKWFKDRMEYLRKLSIDAMSIHLKTPFFKGFKDTYIKGGLK